MDENAYTSISLSISYQSIKSVVSVLPCLGRLSRQRWHCMPMENMRSTAPCPVPFNSGNQGLITSLDVVVGLIVAVVLFHYAPVARSTLS